MAPRQMKMPTKNDFDNEHEEVFSQRKRPESGRYLLQVDRQTKGSYKTSEAAQVAGREIKAAYPIVQVSNDDSIDNTHTLGGDNTRFISAFDHCSGNRRPAVACACVLLRRKTCSLPRWLVPPGPPVPKDRERQFTIAWQR